MNAQTTVKKHSAIRRWAMGGEFRGDRRRAFSYIGAAIGCLTAMLFMLLLFAFGTPPLFVAALSGAGFTAIFMDVAKRLFDRWEREEALER